MTEKIKELEKRIAHLEKWTEALEKVLPEEQALEFFEAFVWKESQKKRGPQRGRARPPRRRR